jgi:hypothetical protein
MLVQTGIVPGSWEAFKVEVRTEFVSQDSSRRARDRLRKLYQKGSVASYNLKKSTRVGPKESAIETLCKAVGILAENVDDLHAKMEQVERELRMNNEKTVERSSGNMLSCNEVAVSDVNKNDSNKTDGCRGDSIPIEPLFCYGWDV